MISTSPDTLSVKEVREADPARIREMAVAWELYTMLPATVAGASVVCVRHPSTIRPLREGIDAFWERKGKGDR
jgi:acetyl-CoA decarbonylase/synthase complex subunit delta